MEEINVQMEQESQIIAAQQQQAMVDQQVQQQQDMQNQIEFGAQQQIAQAQVNKEVDKITGPDEGPNKSELSNRDYETKMLDKKIELEKIRSKKKTVAEQAKDLRLTYVGRGMYADSGNEVTHINENGRLLPYINRN
jgi:hypothetical protein